MKVNRKNLLCAINKVLPGIAVGNVVIEGADTIVFSKGHIYSYNSAISVDVKLPDEMDIEGVVKGQDFYNCLSKLPGEEIEFKVTKSSWEITDGNIKISIKLLPEENLMERFAGLVPTDKWVDIDGEDFNKALKVCTIRNNNSAFGGIYFTGTKAISTNKWIINKAILKNEYPEFWIGDNAVSQLVKWTNFCKVQFNKSWVQFQSTDDVIFSVRSLNITDFPIAKVLPLLETEVAADKAFTLELKPQFYDAINRASEFSHTIDDHEAVVVEFGKEIKIKGSRTSGNYEEIVSDMTVEVPSPKEMNFDFNDFISSEKFFDTFKVVSDTVDFDTSKPIHCLLESETAVKLFSSMN
ncbi:MAG: hypothetical protein IKS93_02435 [Methanobrevibacter sp.]|nr:hypothetical protein [Methanobrevibacter sp.]